MKALLLAFVSYFCLLPLTVSAALALDLPIAPAPLPPDPRFKANVLLVVAHPDDDTAIGAYLARLVDQKKRVAVIYCTSGDGGGDHVGNEAGRSLGEIRIQEARRALASLGIENIWFLDAGDTPGQNVLWSLDHWRHGRILDEMVRLVRLTRPEIILTWLPQHVAGENHADHQAAGVIATEAFDLAGDRTRFSEQVSPARDRTGMMNYTEGLVPWQPQKIYYFSDAFDNFIPYWHDRKDLSPFRANFLDRQGPSYPSTDISASRHKPYSQLAAEELSFYQTQDGRVGQRAIDKNDYSDFEYPVRFILGKSVVGGSAIGDVFEGVTAKPAPFSPVHGFHPEKSNTIEVLLGDPWLFYRQFWQAHDLDHLANLLPVPEIGVEFGGTLHLPMLIENNSADREDITLTPVLPVGWVDKSPYRRFEVPQGDSYQLQRILVAPENGKKEWQELKWNAESGGRSLGTVTLRVYLGKGSALPQ